MSNVVVKIKQVVTYDRIYTVGEVPEGLTDQVEKIKYHGNNTPYNKGLQYEGPCYVVFFNESTARKIIPADTGVVEVGVEKEEEIIKKNKNPEEVGLATSMNKTTNTSEGVE